MKQLLLLATFLVVGLCNAQGKSISLAKKTKEPVTVNDKTVKVGDILYFQLGQNPDGSFRFVQDLNNFNEPVKQSGSRTSMMKQDITFFKEKDGVVYAFTKYFVANLAAALKTGEVEVIESE